MLPKSPRLLRGERPPVPAVGLPENISRVTVTDRGKDQAESRVER